MPLHESREGASGGLGTGLREPIRCRYTAVVLAYVSSVEYPKHGEEPLDALCEFSMH
jgi:hypothetical protein